MSFQGSAVGCSVLNCILSLCFHYDVMQVDRIHSNVEVSRTQILSVGWLYHNIVVYSSFKFKFYSTYGLQSLCGNELSQLLPLNCATSYSAHEGTKR